MNNDISRDITSYDKVKIPTGRIESVRIPESNSMSEFNTDAEAMQCLGTMGCAQVKMQNPVRKSVEEFMADTFLAQAKMDLSDSLVEDRGCDIFKAMEISDNFFKSLKKEDTYRY